MVLIFLFYLFSDIIIHLIEANKDNIALVANVYNEL